MTRDWQGWHDHYDRPGSSLAARLAVVQQQISRALTSAPSGPIRVVSACAGQGRDLLGALVDHPRAGDVAARLVELDEGNVAHARGAIATAGLAGVDVVRGDAGLTDTYVGAVPAEVVMMCGVFGNITHDDVRATIAELPSLCAPGATVIWTRYPPPGDVLQHVCAWFDEAGFEQVVLVTGEGRQRFGVGVHRLTAAPRPLQPGVRLFTFLAVETFDAAIVEGPRGGAYVVVAPDAVVALGGKGRIPVLATFDGIEYQGSVVSMGAEEKILGVRRAIRDALGKGPGDVVTVTLEVDRSERSVAVPEDLRAELERENLSERFAALSYSHQREYVQWIGEAKRPDTRRRRIDQTVERLRADQTS